MSGLRFAPRVFTRNFSNTPKSLVSKVTLIGRLGGPPEQSTTKGGREMIRYNLAVNRGSGENRSTAWWRITSFAESNSKGAEVLLSLEKGTHLYVEGDIWNQVYENAEGQRQTDIQIRQSKFDVLSRPRNQEAVQGQAEE